MPSESLTKSTADANNVAVDANGSKQEAAKTHDDPDNRGFRRIIRNFTPSYATHPISLLLRDSWTGSLKSMQVVYYNNVHRRPLHPLPPTSLPRPLSNLRILHIFLPQHRLFPALHLHHRPPLHSLPTHLLRRAAPSAPEFIFGDISSGVGDADKYDYAGVCASVGEGVGNICMGTLVGGWVVGVGDVLSFDLCDVRALFSSFALLARCLLHLPADVRSECPIGAPPSQR